MNIFAVLTNINGTSLEWVRWDLILFIADVILFIIRDGFILIIGKS
ncbi:hypothetical protein [Clostridium sp.]|nr:hypothetical protein [Clostridium sp.]